MPRPSNPKSEENNKKVPAKERKNDTGKVIEACCEGDTAVKNDEEGEGLVMGRKSPAGGGEAGRNKGKGGGVEKKGSSENVKEGSGGRHIVECGRREEGLAQHKCVLCEAILPSKEDLQEHFRRHANGEIINKPNVGVKSKLKPVSLTGPRSSVWSKVKCDICTEEFENITLAIQHKYKQHPNCPSNHFCEFCGKQFPLEACKQSHIKLEHAKSKKSGEIFKCEECSAEFFTEAAVSYHVRTLHKTVSTILAPVATLQPSKKIKLNNSGENTSVYYCHLCGTEYIVKFNLQKHLEQFHTEEQRNKPPEQLVKCSLCEALFYNKKAYEVHNLGHTPQDLYVTSEQDRKQAVFRVDCDFDLNRVPTIWDKLEGKKRPRVKRLYMTEEKKSSVSASSLMSTPVTSASFMSTPVTSASLVSTPVTSASLVSTPVTSASLVFTPVTSASLVFTPMPSGELKKVTCKQAGRNRALVDSDCEDKSDTSEDSDTEPNPESAQPSAALFQTYP